MVGIVTAKRRERWMNGRRAVLRYLGAAIFECREDDATDVDHTSSNPPQKAISPGCEDVIRDQAEITEWLKSFPRGGT